jgi:serine/threonine-protein kinase
VTFAREGQEFAGRYRLVRRLGEGGFGTVFEAEHLRIPGRRLALKVLNPLLTADPKLRDRFLREVEAASRLTHPHVIVMREVDATPEGVYFCTMDLSPGRSLRQLLHEEGRLDVARAVRLAAQVLDALGHAHERGVVHRDMKPENVLVEVDAQGRECAKVLDFGLAKLTDEGDAGGVRSQFTTPGSVVGTLQYIAPEQAEAEVVDGRADQYTVAVMLFELVTGRLPFESPTPMGYAIAHMTRPPPFLRPHAPGAPVTDALEEAMQRALAKRPEERYPDAYAFRAALLASIGLSEAEVAAGGASGRFSATAAAGGAPSRAPSGAHRPPATPAPTPSPTSPPERTLPRAAASPAGGSPVISGVLPSGAAAIAPGAAGASAFDAERASEIAGLATFSPSSIQRAQGAGALPASGPLPASRAPEAPPATPAAASRIAPQPAAAPAPSASEKTVDEPPPVFASSPRPAGAGPAPPGHPRTMTVPPPPPALAPRTPASAQATASVAHTPAPAAAAAPAPGAIAGLGPGVVVGRYRIEKVIGGGGMGQVYRARHVHMNRIAALKVLQPEIAGDAAIRARFLREARIASVLHHPCVVELYDFDDVGGFCTLAMQLVDGRPLHDVLAAEPERRLAPERVARIFDQVLDALAAAHRAGIVHRDLKPSNIMVGRDDKVTILDFGIARIREPEGQADNENLTQLGEFLGTPAYAAPEQIQGRVVDGRTDLYTAAVILFQLLAGRRPFECPTAKGYLAKHIVEAPPPLSTFRPDLPRIAELDAICARGLAKDPKQRFQSADEMRAALLAVLPPPPPIPGSGILPSAAFAAAALSAATPAPPAAAAAPPAMPPLTGALPGVAAPAPAAPAPPPGGRKKSVTAMPTFLPGAEAGPGAALSRLLVLARGARGLSKLFVIGGTRLAFGRSREDERRGVRNHVVLRLLPCRDQAQDPANWSATMRLSNAHGEVEVEGARATVRDRSSRGMSLSGAPLAKEVATPLPDVFDLDIAQGALRLHGRIARGGIGPEAPVESVVLRRVGNAEGHVYALVRAALTIGSDPGCAVAADAPGLAPCHAVIEHAGGAYRIYSAAGPEDAPPLVDGVALGPGEAAPLGPGTRARLGGLDLEVRDLADGEFTAM